MYVLYSMCAHTLTNIYPVEEITYASLYRCYILKIHVTGMCNTVLMNEMAEACLDFTLVLTTGDTSMWSKAWDKHQNKDVRYLRWRVQMCHVIVKSKGLKIPLFVLLLTSNTVVGVCCTETIQRVLQDVKRRERK